MKAIVIDEYGDASKLHLADVAEPKPGADEVKIEVAAASINPIDWKLRSGAYQGHMKLVFPHIPGRDASGVVVQVGAGVSQFKLGDRVLGLVWSSYAQFVVAPSAAWAHLPARADLSDAAAIPLAALTGVQLIEEAADVTAGQLVLITGAVGAVGRFAVHAARARGAQVIVGVRRKQLAEAQRLGASSVVALDDESSIDSLPALDVIADTVGGTTLDGLVRKVKRGGMIASTIAEPKSAKSRDIATRHMQAHPDSARLEACAKAIAAGELQLPIERRFPLSEAAHAQALAEAGGVGKVLLIV